MGRYTLLHFLICVVMIFTMKKIHKILIILLVIIAIVAGLVWWQFGNIKAVYYWWKYSGSDIDDMLGSAHSGVEDYLKDNPQYSVRPSKPVEEELHKDGVITDDELTELITEETSVKEMFGTELELSDDKKLTITETGEQIDAETAKKLKENAAQKEEQPKETPTGNDAEISACVAQMYVLKSSFVAQLEGLYNQAFGEYEAVYDQLNEAEREAKKKSIISSLYPKASALEKQCDTQVNQVLAKLEALLKESGGDTSLVGRIRDSYNSEKSLKKAYYLNQI